MASITPSMNSAKSHPSQRPPSRWRRIFRLCAISVTLLSAAACIALSILTVRGFFVGEVFCFERVDPPQASADGQHTVLDALRTGVQSRRGETGFFLTWQRELTVATTRVVLLKDGGPGRRLRRWPTDLRSPFYSPRTLRWQFLGIRWSDVSFNFGPLGTTARERTLILPAWLALCVTALPPAFWMIRMWRKRRYGPGLCPTCGYDLRATPHRCPECGRAIMKSTSGEQ
ncbi:MAG: hypothetical protein ACREJC_15245 [Tepidisphaeraceae bacterium]